jgi:hypothetical protein
LQESDILEVLETQGLCRDGAFKLVKLRPECRDKFGGHEHVAAALRRLSVSPGRREGQMSQIMEHLLKETQLREIIFTNASEDAL